MRDADFSHIKNDLPTMVDVSDKTSTMRCARATSTIVVPSFVTDGLLHNELITKKGPVFSTAIIAGTMAVKRTASLIPFCHPLSIEHVNIGIVVEEPGCIVVTCLVKSFGRTGVEMEALTGASIAALTIYDMCKSLSFDISIRYTKLIEKSGGKNDGKSRNA